MEGYLGETHVEVSQTKFKDFTPSDWALFWIERCGQFDGSHHKQWTLDQIARILNGTKVIIKLAKWDNGTEEYRFILDEPSQEYLNWVKEMKDGEDGPDTYTYDEGIAP